MKSPNRSREFTDVYSHTSESKEVKNKSRGFLKCFLCFCFLILSVTMCVGCYVVGIYVSNETNSANLMNASSKNDDTLKTSAEFNSSAIACAEKYVVGIYVYNTSSCVNASGIIVSDDGYIITNDHIFDGMDSPDILVYTSDGKSYPAAFTGGDTKFDLAVIKIEARGLVAAEIKKSATVSVGDSIYVIGCPMGETLSMSVSSGIVSGVNRRVSCGTDGYAEKVIQTDAAINPGCSGGALINADGKLIGVSCSKIVDESYEGIGFAIPIGTVNSVLNDMIDNGHVTGRARLGIKYKSYSYSEALINGKSPGIMIESISAESDLFSSGFTAGDVIVAINDIRIRTEGDFLDAIEKASPGEKVRLIITTASGAERETDAVLLEDNSSTSFSG